MQKSYDLVNVELSWLSPGEIWKLRAYGRNLADEEYSTVSDTGNLGDAVSAAPPRTFGAAVQYNF